MTILNEWLYDTVYYIFEIDTGHVTDIKTLMQTELRLLVFDDVFTHLNLKGYMYDDLMNSLNAKILVGLVVVDVGTVKHVTGVKFKTWTIRITNPGVETLPPKRVTVIAGAGLIEWQNIAAEDQFFLRDFIFNAHQRIGADGSPISIILNDSRLSCTYDLKDSIHIQSIVKK